MVQPREIFIYAKRQIIREALQFLLDSYGYQNVAVDSMPALQKMLKRKHNAVIIFSGVNDFMSYELSVLTQQVIVLKVSKSDGDLTEAYCSKNPNIRMVDGFKGGENINLLLAELLDQ